jgi:hypothetical protein
MQTISYYWGTAGNRLIFAINHYVLTGEDVGEGVMGALGDGRFMVYIPVEHRSPTRVADFECFRSRFDELAPLYGTTLEFVGRGGASDEWRFAIRGDQMDALATDLRERPGQSGWGSTKEEAEATESATREADDNVGAHHLFIIPPQF